MVSAALFIACQGALLSLGRQEPAIYLLWVAAALGLLVSLPATPLWERFMGLSTRQTLMVLLVLALVARFVMLLNTQEHTKDMELLLERTQLALDGEIPYTDDFAVNKPPLYLYTAWSLGLLVGAENVPMRAALSLVDVLTVAALFWLIPFGQMGLKTHSGAGEADPVKDHTNEVAREVRSDEDADIDLAGSGGDGFPESRRHLAALGLALCPANIFMIGFSGHYEPFVILSVLLGLGFHLRGRQEASALLLGLGFAWKFYPALFLPLILARIPTWRARLLYILLFGVPFLLSLLPILYLNPDGLYDYFFGYQGGDWVEKTLRGFAAGLVVFTDSSEMAGLAWSWVTAGLFGLALALFVLARWARNPAPAPLTEPLEGLWQKLMMLTRRWDPAEDEVAEADGVVRADGSVRNERVDETEHADKADRTAGADGTDEPDGADGKDRADGTDETDEAYEADGTQWSIAQGKAHNPKGRESASASPFNGKPHLALWANRALLLFLLYHLWQWTQEWVLHPQGGIELSRWTGAAIVIVGSLLLLAWYRGPWWPRLFLTSGSEGISVQIEEEANGTPASASHDPASPASASSPASSSSSPAASSAASSAHSPTCSLLLGSIIVVLLVLWGSPDYCAWYSMWLIPLALLLPRAWGRWWLYLLLLANIP